MWLQLDAKDYGGYGSGLDATYEAMFPGSGMYYWQLKYVLCFKKEDAIVATVICQVRPRGSRGRLQEIAPVADRGRLWEIAPRAAAANERR